MPLPRGVKKQTAKVSTYPKWQCVNCGAKISDPRGPCPEPCKSKKFVRYKEYQVREV